MRNPVRNPRESCAKCCVKSCSTDAGGSLETKAPTMTAKPIMTQLTGRMSPRYPFASIRGQNLALLTL